MEEPGEEETVEILKGLRKNYELHHQVEITDAALEAAAALSRRYISDRFLPDKAIDLMDEAAARVRLGGVLTPGGLSGMENESAELLKEMEEAVREQDFERASVLRGRREELEAKIEKEKKRSERAGSRKKLTVGENEIAQIVAEWTKIPVSKLAETETQRLQKLEKILHKRVIAQNEAVEAVAKAVRRRTCRTSGPEPSDWFLFIPRSYGSRKDGAFQGACRGSLWKRRRHDPCRHVRIYGEAQRIPSDWSTAGICRT